MRSIRPPAIGRVIEQAGTGHNSDRGKIENLAVVAQQSSRDDHHGSDYDCSGNSRLSRGRSHVSSISSLMALLERAGSKIEGQPRANKNWITPRKGPSAIESLQLIRAFVAIEDFDLRRSILELTEHISVIAPRRAWIDSDYESLVNWRNCVLA